MEGLADGEDVEKIVGMELGTLVVIRVGK